MAASIPTEKKEIQCDPITGEPLPEYVKLMKQLGPQNRNKEMRIQCQSKLTEKIESPLSSVMWIGANPGYHMDDQMQESHFMETFKGKKDEDTDKVYFRKKDEMVTYTEHAVKS